MAQIINIGNESNDGTGDSIRDAFRKANENFSELYGVNNLGAGLFITKLQDAPQRLIPSGESTASILVVDYFGNTMTNKLLVAGYGIKIDNTSSEYITISNPNTSLATDLNPQLGGNLDARSEFRGINFKDPIDSQDVSTKYYADTNSPYSKVNLYVSTNGRDVFNDSGKDAVPIERRGRSLAYAFRTLNYACQVAETIINTSTVELSTYQQFLTINNGNTTATVYTTASSVTITSGVRVYIDPGLFEGSDQYVSANIKPGQYLVGNYSTTIGFIETYGTELISGTDYEWYDVTIISGPGYTPGESLLFSYRVPTTNITIFVESGEYEEELPIRVPNSVSIRGDEFRRCIIKPAPLTSSSKWARLYFRRDDEFDGLTRQDNNGRAGLAPQDNPFGYHYLTNPLDVNSPPKLNSDMDVFLLNDSTILRAISVAGHGGFMCVLDPEGQILTKSPYIQNCSSFSKSVNEQTFSGGQYVDGFAGNLQCLPGDAITYFTGTTTISVSGLIYRQPQTPTAFYYLGNRYQVDYFTTGTNIGEGILHLNPRNNGGIAFANGVIPVNSGTGYSAGNKPIVLFDQPTGLSGFPAQGTANINAGVITSVTITNPGSGYTGTVYLNFVGGNPTTPAGRVTITGNNIRRGFVGIVPPVVELLTAGNKSMLSADFTQLNDLGYGFVCNNGAKMECVSDFTYYAHTSYYSKNGGNIRSLNGSSAYGNYSLKSEGASPNEVPLPVYLATDMIQTATVVAQSFSGLNTLNTAGSTTIYVKGWQYFPFNQSEIEIDHGYITNSVGDILGLQTYSVASVNTVTNGSAYGISDLIQLNLSNANLFGSSSGGLKSPLSSGTSVTIRALDVFKVTGINAQATYSGAPALQMLESTATTYHILGFDFTDCATGDGKVRLREDFDYVKLQTYNTSTAAGGTTINIYDLDTTAASRITAQNGTTLTQMTFAWKGGIYRITNYASSATLAQPYARITIHKTLGSTITNVSGAASVQLKAGFRQYTPAQITKNISLVRASNHDMINIGAGSFYESRYPNDIFGPPSKIPGPQYERVEANVGRVFAVTNDQDGNFKVGDYFQVNQASGDLTIKASLNLTQVSGLGFKRGVVVSEFSPDPTMLQGASDVVPTQVAVIGYVSNRLGLNSNGLTSGVGLIGPGYLDLTGVQLMKGAINMDNHKIINVTSCTNAFDAAPKIYADQKISKAGLLSIDPATGLVNSDFGKMTGPLQLSRDPLSTDNGSIAASKRYVDRYSRQVATLDDVSLTTPQNQDLLMFSSVTQAVNTGSVSPIWSATNQIVNVGLNPTSDVEFTRTGNSLKIIVSANTITNAQIYSGAQIDQSKLAMGVATAGAWAGTIAQANLGLAKMDSTYFTSTSGFVSIYNPTNFNVIAKSSNKLEKAVNATGYLKASAGDASFNAVNSSTWYVDASTTNTNGTIVARDGSGNIYVSSIFATNGVTGIATSSTGLLVNNSFYATGNTSTVANTIVARDSNANIWANFFNGTSVKALYADLAEKYISDAVYEPGTVLEFGGEYEVTIAEDSTRRVAGVVSTNPAYLMNSGLAGDNVVAVALTGRVPVKVRGNIRKGDMLVSAGSGYARAEYSPMLGSVIGKALENFSGVEGIIEVVVGKL